MFICRCPYCGEELSFIDNVLVRLYARPLKCSYCANKYIIHYPKIYKTIIPWLIYFFLLKDKLDMINNVVIHLIVLSIVVIVFFLLALFVPLDRYEDMQLFSQWCAEHRAVAAIKWNKKYMWLRFLIYSGFITPVCFCDEHKRPISQMWCLSFKRLRHIGKKTICKVEFVVDTAPVELLESGNRFIIFYKKEQIGEGIIKKLEY